MRDVRLASRYEQAPSPKPEAVSIVEDWAYCMRDSIANVHDS